MEHESSLPFSQSWARSIYSVPSHPVSLKSVLALSSHLSIVSPSRLIRWSSPTENLYEFLFVPMRATYRGHLIFFDVILIILGEEYKLWCSRWNFLHTYVTSSLIGPPRYPAPCSQTPLVQKMDMLFGFYKTPPTSAFCWDSTMHCSCTIRPNLFLWNSFTIEEYHLLGYNAL
jgi:hypothetical protein